ncbi:MAG: hypothetical protein H6716_03450 [Polyangiaceae bacterium]|nr:hypothetical protein [Polyangiaceae bacterium]
MALVTLCLAGALLGLMIGVRLVSHDKRRLLGAVGSGLVTTLAVAYLQLKLPPRALPLEWLRILHEGGGSILLEATYGTPRSGPAFRALIETYTPTGTLAIRGAAHLNLCLTLVCAGLLFCVGHYILRASLPALVFVTAYLANVQTRSVATSELPSVVLELCFLLGVISFEAIRREHQLGGVWGLLSQVQLALAVSVAFLCRMETFLVGGPALLVSWLQRSDPTRLDVIQSRLTDWFRRVVSAPRYLLVLAGVSSFALKYFLSGKVVWVTQALNPFDPSLAMYPVLLVQFVPLGIVVLFVCGWIYCLRDAARLGLLPLTLIALFKLYESAGHRVTFELLRYTSGLSTAMFFFGLFGWRQLEALAERAKLDRKWRAPTIIALVATSLVPPPRVDGILRAPVNRDHQRAGQALIRAIEAHPSCTLVTKHVDRDGGRTRYTFFGRQQPVSVPAESGLESALQRVAPDTDCAVFYFGLDCNRVDLPCAKEASALPEIERSVWRSEPYSDRRGYGEHSGELMFATFAIHPKGAPLTQ